MRQVTQANIQEARNEIAVFKMFLQKDPDSMRTHKNILELLEAFVIYFDEAEKQLSIPENEKIVTLRKKLLSARANGNKKAHDLGERLYKEIEAKNVLIKELQTTIKDMTKEANAIRYQLETSHAREDTLRGKVKSLEAGMRDANKLINGYHIAKQHHKPLKELVTALDVVQDGLGRLSALYKIVVKFEPPKQS